MSIPTETPAIRLTVHSILYASSSRRSGIRVGVGDSVGVAEVACPNTFGYANREVGSMVGVGEFTIATAGVGDGKNVGEGSAVGVGVGAGHLLGLFGVAVYSGAGMQIVQPAPPSTLRPIEVLYPRMPG